MSTERNGSFWENNRRLVLVVGGALGLVALILLYQYSAPKPDVRTASAPTGAASAGKVLQVGALPVT